MHRTTSRTSRAAHRSAWALAIAVIVSVFVAPVTLAAPQVPNNSTSTSGFSPSPTGKSHLVQDPNWLAKKLAHNVVRPGATSRGVNAAIIPYTTIGELSTSVVQNTLEPWGTTPGTNNCTNDDASPPHCYVDKNFWGLCGPGAVANALQY